MWLTYLSTALSVIHRLGSTNDVQSHLDHFSYLFVFYLYFCSSVFFFSFLVVPWCYCIVLVCIVCLNQGLNIIFTMKDTTVVSNDQV